MVEISSSEHEQQVECLVKKISLLESKISDLEYQLLKQQVTSGDGVCDSVEDIVNETLEKQQQFVYVESCRMYYHYKSGYYFNDDSCLFFDAKSSIYLKFNPRTESFMPVERSVTKTGDDSVKYESNIADNCSNEESLEVVDNDDVLMKRDEVEESPYQCNSYIYDSNSGYYYNQLTDVFFEPVSRRYFKYDRQSEQHFEVTEDGIKVEQQHDETDNEKTEDLDISQSCLRLVVLSSEMLDLGTLYIVTPSDSKPLIGSNKSCSVHIPSPEASTFHDNVRSFHCKLRLNKDDNCWEVRAVNDSCECILNGKQLSTIWTRLIHGVNLQLGKTLTLSVHIHFGCVDNTCDGCEPALVRSFFDKKKKLVENPDNASFSSCGKSDSKVVSIEQQRRSTNQRLKNSLGLNVQSNQNLSKVANGYEDKAEKRRQTVGSEPSIGYSSGCGISASNSGEVSPLNAASVEKPIDKKNIGFKLLSNMGYVEGSGLGKDGKGIVEPINVDIRQPGVGLSSNGAKFSLDDHKKADKYNKQWSKAAQRYANLS